MTGARTMLSLMSILCLLLLAGCGDNASQCLTPNLDTPSNLPLLSATEAIKLAKEATKTLSSPPSVLYIPRPAFGTGGDIVAWPDQPGSIASICRNEECNVRGITYTTSLKTDSNIPGQYVTFSSEWVNPTLPNAHHSWQFYVGNDHMVRFLCEQGDRLPYRQH